MKRYFTCFIFLALMMAMISGCGKQTEQTAESDHVIDKADTSGMEFEFDESDTTVEENQKSETVQLPDTVTGSKNYEITAGGGYTLTGTKEDVMILVDADGEEVTLILDGATIQNSNGPAIYVRAAKKVTLTLAAGTVNTLSDGSSYNITDSDSTLDGAIFSKADLTVNGTGALEVFGNYKHGIVSKDDLILSSGTLRVTSKGVALNGKDCVKINGGNVVLTAGSDGIRADNTEDSSRGYVYLYGGALQITAGNDGIQAETVLNIEEVDLQITSGGGSGTSLSSTEESYKGLKAGSDIYITGGTFDIQSRDDCIHSNGTITISGGNYTLSSGDDGAHADTDLEISGDSTVLNVTKSYEGLEATDLVIKGGKLSICASDDGLNAAGGNNTSNEGGMMRPGMGQFSSSTGSITISGGELYIEMDGDGLDANGTLTVTGGHITVAGANRGDTAILDFDSVGNINGGTFIGTGSTGMSQNFSTSSTQGVIMLSAGSQSAGTKIELLDESGKVLLTHTAERDFSCVMISHSSIKNGGTYTLKVGSSSADITMTGTVYGSGGMGGNIGGMGGPGGGMGGGHMGGGPRW